MHGGVITIRLNKLPGERKDDDGSSPILRETNEPERRLDSLFIARISNRLSFATIIVEHVSFNADLCIHNVVSLEPVREL